MLNTKLKPVVLAVAGVLVMSANTFAADAIKAEKVEVVSVTPLPGIGLTEDKIPANIQKVSGDKMVEQGAATIADFMNSNMSGVNVVETQGNPFQPDLTFHGFSANALLGAPQGLSVYQDGVRLNEAFGDVVSWDLIPMNAIKQMQLIPGTNPLYGLNTLGGAISLQTKRGRDVKGGAVQALAGSWGRNNAQFEYGNLLDNGVDYFVSGNYFDENGWRDASSTTIRQMFGQIGWQNEKTDLNLTMSLADNDMVGNGLVPQEMMRNLGRQAIYTKPDQTINKMAFLNLTGSHWLNDETMLSGNLYYRNVRTRTLNGDINDDVDEVGGTNTYQTVALQQAACIANTNNTPVLDCNGALNRSNTRKNGAGGTLQVAFNQPLAGHSNQLITGVGFDYSNINFFQNRQYGYLNSDRGITPLSYYQDHDEWTSLKGDTYTWSGYATDTFSINDKWHLTASGRYNHTKVENVDQINPPGTYLTGHPNDPLYDQTLTGNHTFSRLNPAVGLNFTPTKDLTFYGSYNEGSRAPTSMELGCANPNVPCKMPNAMAGDPPLKQVVTRSVDLGAKGRLGESLTWSLAAYHAENDDDIHFTRTGTRASSPGYFSNVGTTSREGIDLALSGKFGKLSLLTSYSYINARYEDSFQGFVGNNLNKTKVAPGDLIPGIPANQLKVRGAYQFTPQFNLGLNLLAFSSQILQGNENNGYYSNGTSYLGNGRAPGYSIVNLDANYKFENTGWEVFAKVNNIFDKDYVTGGMQASSMFDKSTNAYVGDDYRTSLFAPGAPRAGWIGVRYEFGGAKKSDSVDRD